MAASTVTIKKYGKDERFGHVVRKHFNFNITSAGADGATVSASALGLNTITSVRIVGQETGGYVAQFLPTSRPTAEWSYLGDGVIRVYEAGADAAVLDEVTSGDLGEFLVEVEGF